MPSNVKLEKGGGVKRERDEEYDEILASAQVKKAKTRPFGYRERVVLDE